VVLNGGDQPTGVLVAGQGVGSGNKGIAEAERSKSEAGRDLRIEITLCTRLLHLVVGWPPRIMQTVSSYPVNPGMYCLGLRITDESHRQI